MNPILRFSSQLTLDDLKKFLVKYGGFHDCLMEENVRPAYANEIHQYFFHDGISYVFTYSDYYILLKMICGDEGLILEQKKFTNSDWLCFLKSKFGPDFVEYYASEFRAEDIVYSEPRFLAKISFDEFAILIKGILKENSKELLPFDINDSDIEIIEKESFFRSERRFAVRKQSTDLYFFIRFSDFQSVSPRLSGNFFFKFMAGKFGPDYIDEYHRNIYNISRPSNWRRN